MKKVMFDLLPPASVVFIILFWAKAPAWFVEAPWSLPLVAIVTLMIGQLLELVHERHASWRINKRELLTDAFYVVFSSTVIQWLTTHLADDPLRTLKTSLGIETQWTMHLPFAVQAMLVVVLIEFGQYWMHRLMHNNSFFWSTHAPHHHLTQLNAMKGNVGNPLELFLISLSVVSLFDFPQAAIFAGLSVIGVVAMFAHANVRSDPPIWYSYFFTTIRHHSLHHTALSYEDTRCNYGCTIIIFDRILGTFREGESEIVGQGERVRLSIREQFLFPLRPLIAMINARRKTAAPEAG
jgi:sterol desaturase/sphingolipid hydroxylase (fatty acid hydroxylase superfamily)